MTECTPGKVSSRVLLAYALPAFVVALPTIPVYIHLPVLYGIELGLGLATTGYVLLIARLFDTVTDPLVGALCDRYSFRGNRRKPWIAAGGVIAGIGLFKILNPPADIDAGYLLGWSVVLYAGWTMVAVPYLAWGAELSADYNERTRITAWREGLALLGIIGAIAWAAIALGVVCIPILLWTVPEGSASGHAPKPVSIREIWDESGSLVANRPFLRLLSAWFLNGLANGIPAALFFVYLEHGLGAGARHRPPFVLTYFVAAIIAIPLWQTFSRRVGKHRTWCWAMVWANATICSLNSAGYGFLVLSIWTLSSKGQSVSIKPGELQLATGARRGELLALRWSDVDFENLRIKIWRSLEETADGLRFKTTKTFHGRHHITLPKEAMVALQAHRRGQMELRLKLGLGRMPDDALVFGKVNGQPQSPRAITKAWSRLVKAHDLPKVTLHGLRHTHASALIASGVDVLTVSRRLGHASPTITLGVYEHLFSDTDSRAADVIGKALSKTIA